MLTLKQRRSAEANTMINISHWSKALPPHKSRSYLHDPGRPEMRNRAFWSISYKSKVSVWPGLRVPIEFGCNFSNEDNSREMLAEPIHTTSCSKVFALNKDSFENLLESTGRIYKCLPPSNQPNIGQSKLSKHNV
ncbi:hypothetical protein J6590_007255 [Homalodisca vitripennis]|nr:hypothetical protein J6590_007255 [Homalodisca vitripennis]